MPLLRAPAYSSCCLATFGTVVGYHKVMREVCREYKHVTGLCDADDTILHGQQATAAFRLKVKLQRERCGLTEVVKKAGYYVPSGNYTDAPLDIPIVSEGFEVLGVFHGADGHWCAEQLDAKLNGTVQPDGSRVGGKLAALPAVEALHDTERVKNIKQLQQRVTRVGASVRPVYWGRNMRPSRTRVAMSRFDRRIDHTLELISGAKDANGRFLSPVDRRVRALKQQHLPICLGGSGVHNNAGCCAAEWVSSVVGTLATVREFVPRLAEIDVLTSQLPFFVELRSEYEVLYQTRLKVASLYTALDEAKYFSFDGKEKSKFHPKGLPPASAVPPTIASFVNDASSTTAPSHPPSGPCTRSSHTTRHKSQVVVPLLRAPCGQRDQRRQPILHLHQPRVLPSHLDERRPQRRLARRAAHVVASADQQV